MRLKVVRDAIRYKVLPAVITPTDSTPSPSPGKSSPTPIPTASPTQLSDEQIDAAEYPRLRGITNPNDLVELEKSISAKHEETDRTVTIPLFGVVIQCNDLGLIGGFTFTILLIMLRLSMVRSLLNLRLTFNKLDADKTNDRRDVYNLLSMSQVLTIPPSEENPKPGIWKFLTKTFIFLPLLVQIFIASVDVSTWRFGVNLSPGDTGLALLGNFLFMGLTTTLTYSCIILSREYDQEWLTQFGRLNLKEKTTPG